MDNHSSLAPKERATGDRRGSETIIPQHVLFEEDNFTCKFFKKLNKYRKSSQLTDVILCVKEDSVVKEFPCHRIVLAASSDYFKAMFSSHLKETRENRAEISDIKANILQAIIEYAYHGKIEISVDNVEGILAAASCFLYTGITDACWEFLAKHIHPSNCLRVEQLAHLYGKVEVATAAHTYALDNFSSVIEYEEFLELPKTILLSYLSSDLIYVPNEEYVYNAVMTWVNHNVDERKDALHDVLEKVRFSDIDVHFLESIVIQNPLITSQPDCVSLINNSRRVVEHTENTTTHYSRRSRVQPRLSTLAKELLLSIGGLNDHDTVTLVDMYDPSKDRWQMLPDLPLAVSFFSVSVVNNRVYLCGGVVDKMCVPLVWCFDPHKRLWSTAPNMLTPRARHTSAVWQNRMYVLGGVTTFDDDYLSSCTVVADTIDCFDEDMQQWTCVGYSPLPRSMSHSAVSNGGSLLLEVGGSHCGGRGLSTIECYQCSHGTVLYSGEQFVLSEPILYGKILLLDQLFYILWEDTRKLISLNPERRIFRRLADMKFSHVHGSVSLVAGKIYVTGGYHEGRAIRECECYDPGTDTWVSVKRLSSDRAHHMCVTLKMCS